MMLLMIQILHYLKDPKLWEIWLWVMQDYIIDRRDISYKNPTWVVLQIRIPWGSPLFFFLSGCRTVVGDPKRDPYLENYPYTVLRTLKTS